MKSLDGPPKWFRHATLSTTLFQHRNSRDRDCYFERTLRGLLAVFHLVNAGASSSSGRRGRLEDGKQLARNELGFGKSLAHIILSSRPSESSFREDAAAFRPLPPLDARPSPERASPVRSSTGAPATSLAPSPRRDRASAPKPAPVAATTSEAAQLRLSSPCRSSTGPSPRPVDWRGALSVFLWTWISPAPCLWRCAAISFPLRSSSLPVTPVCLTTDYGGAEIPFA